MERTIVHEFSFDVEAQIVWKYLTESDLLALWLMPNDFMPIIGHQFTYSTKPKVKLGFDGRIYCQVLEVVPNERLVYSWRGGLPSKKPLLDTVVIWTLQASTTGCILRLEHKGFKGLKNFLPYVIMNKGWAKIGDRLSKLADV